MEMDEETKALERKLIEKIKNQLGLSEEEANNLIIQAKDSIDSWCEENFMDSKTFLEKVKNGTL